MKYNILINNMINNYTMYNGYNMRDRAEYVHLLKYRYGCNDQFETWVAMNSCVTIASGQSLYF